MKTYFTTIRFLPLAWALGGILLLMITASRTAYAKLCLSPDPRGGVLDADVVAIVKQTTLDLFGGEQLHESVIRFLTDQQRQYWKSPTEDSLDATFDRDYRMQLRRTALSTDGELFYGLEGLASFKNPSDLPFIRQFITWAATQRLEQTCWAALNIFRDVPDKMNLPVLGTIFERFGGFTEELSAHSYFDSLKALKIPDTIPFLVKILPDSFMGASAHELLTEIVGTDLGTDPKAWLKWKTGHTGQSQKP